MPQKLLTQQQVNGTVRLRTIEQYITQMPLMAEHCISQNGQTIMMSHTPQNNITIFDLGCGEGHALRGMERGYLEAKQTCQLTGVDLFPPKDKVGVTWIKENLENMSLEPNKADYIISAATFPYIDKVAHLLQQVSWCLKRDTGIGFIYLPSCYLGPYAQEIIKKCEGLLTYHSNNSPNRKDKDHYLIVKPCPLGKDIILDAFNSYINTPLPLALQLLFDETNTDSQTTESKADHITMHGLLDEFYPKGVFTTTARGIYWEMLINNREDGYFRLAVPRWFIPKRESIYNVAYKVVKQNAASLSKEDRNRREIILILLENNHETLRSGIDQATRSQDKKLLLSLIQHLSQEEQDDIKYIYHHKNNHQALCITAIIASTLLLSMAIAMNAFLKHLYNKDEPASFSPKM